MANPNKPNTNTPSFATLLAEAKEMGENKGKADDIQVQFALKIIHAAYAGALSPDPDKHGPGIHDGVLLAEAYVKGRNGAVIFDRKQPNQRKLISNTLKMIRLGSTGKWGVGQPIGIVNDVMSLRLKLAKAGKKVYDAYNALTQFATAQLKSPHLIDDDELESFCVQADPDPRTAEEVLEGIRKMATKLMTGKVTNCPDQDDSDEVKGIVRQCTRRLTAIAKARAATTIPVPDVVYQIEHAPHQGSEQAAA